MRKNIPFAEPLINPHPAAKDGPKVFDWDKAAALIKEHGIQNASAGLAEDWSWTSDLILKGGIVQKDAFCYLYSVWATPILVDEDADEEYVCYCAPGVWDEDTVWPDSALEILGE